LTPRRPHNIIVRGSEGENIDNIMRAMGEIGAFSFD